MWGWVNTGTIAIPLDTKIYIGPLQQIHAGTFPETLQSFSVPVIFLFFLLLLLMGSLVLEEKGTPELCLSPPSKPGTGLGKGWAPFPQLSWIHLQKRVNLCSVVKSVSSENVLCASKLLSVRVYTHTPGMVRSEETSPLKHNRALSWSQVFFWKTPWGAHMCHGPFCFLMEQTQGTAPGVKNRQGKKRLWQWGFCYYFYMPCYGEDEARASSAFALHRAARGAPPTCSSPHRSSGLSCTEQVCPKS